MLSFLTSKFNPLRQDEFYPNPRSEGRVKSYDSCSDFRAWSLHEQDLHDYLVHVIKLNDVDPYGFLSKRTFFDLLKVVFRGASGEGVDEFVQRPAVEAAAVSDPGTGDGGYSEEIAERDKEINCLKNELDILEQRYRALQDRLDEMLASGMDMERVKQVFQDSEDKDRLIEELQERLDRLQCEQTRLLEQNAQLARNVDRFSEHIETLSDLKERISEYAECGQLLLGNDDKYRQLLEDTLQAVIGREAMCTNKELKKERKKYEDQIKEQLAQMLEMYEFAMNSLKQREEELEKKNAELENYKLEQDLMVSKGIYGGEDRRIDEFPYGDEDNESIATIEEILVSTSAPIISIEMTQNINNLHHRNTTYTGCTREDLRNLNATVSDQRMQEFKNKQIRGVSEETKTITRRHRITARSRNYPIIASRNITADSNEYTLHGTPSIELRIPFTNYTLLLKPDT